jgi:uncharacterized membrane protein
VTLRKYLVLAGIAVFAASGDSMLSHGMKQTGSVSIEHLGSLIVAVLNPSVAIGIVLLIGFFATYTTALSWADLTYVMPATSMGYVLVALVAKFGLHEHVSASRWLGIVLITGGVGFVAGGPEITRREDDRGDACPNEKVASARGDSPAAGPRLSSPSRDAASLDPTQKRARWGAGR